MMNDCCHKTNEQDGKLLTVSARLIYLSMTSWTWKQKKIMTMIAKIMEKDETEAKKL